MRTLLGPDDSNNRNYDDEYNSTDDSDDNPHGGRACAFIVRGRLLFLVLGLVLAVAGLVGGGAIAMSVCRV